MPEFYETELDADFDGVKYDALSIGRRKDGSGIEFATRDSGNASAAVIGFDKIWDVIDHLIEIAGGRAYATPEEHS